MLWHCKSVSLYLQAISSFSRAVSLFSEKSTLARRKTFHLGGGGMFVCVKINLSFVDGALEIILA